MTTNTKEVSAAFVKAQKEFGPALKSSTNPHFKSKYADLAACVEAVIDALNKNGIALLQRNIEAADGVTVETVFVHESGEQLSSGPLHVPAAKHDPQGYGSAMTYARRYSLMAACGIAPEDDDGNAAVKAPPRGVAAAVLATSPAIEAKRAEYLAGLASDLVREADEGRTAGAILDAIDAEKLDDVEKIYLSTKMPAALKRALQDESRKRHQPKKETATQ